MKLTVAPIARPQRVTVTLELDEWDFQAAFTQAADPNEILYYEAWSEAGAKRSVSDQLVTLAKIAMLVEGNPIEAANLNISATVEPT